MVNTMKEIVDKLEGYTSDNQGYAVMSFNIEANGFRLSVKPYLKAEGKEGKKDSEHLMEMCSRLLDKYQKQGRHFTVVEAVRMGSGAWENRAWNLLLEEIFEDEKAED